MTDGGSGHAAASDQCPTWAASEANFRDHLVRLRNWRRRYCLRRSYDGYDKASSSNQPDRRALPWVKVEKEYAFDTPEGKRTLAELFDGAQPIDHLSLHDGV
jgi:predicted dithiol-disulfide oxidoreductase (DUF899 family)